MLGLRRACSAAKRKMSTLRSNSKYLYLLEVYVNLKGSWLSYLEEYIVLCILYILDNLEMLYRSFDVSIVIKLASSLLQVLQTIVYRESVSRRSVSCLLLVNICVLINCSVF